MDGFLYDIACTDENWFKNQTLKHLPHKLRTFSIDSVYAVHSQLTVLECTSILIVFILIMSVLIILNFYVLLCNVAVKHSIKAFIF